MKRHLLAGTDLTVSALCCGGADFGTAVMAPANERLATTFTAMAGYRRTDAWLSPAWVGADLDDSLSRLDVDTIDLFWLHRDDTRMSVGEIVEALNAEIQRSRVRFLGARNWSAARISAANAYAAEHEL